MSIFMFQTNLKLIKVFVRKLQRESIPLSMQKILIKAYADDLRIYLTENMIQELVSH